ncbi:MAG: integrase [Chloroflexota bacterium]|nr:MAG: integrase [Chloroflexota bacterium]
MTTAIITPTDNRQEAIQAVLNSMSSQHSRRAYQRALNNFLDWHTGQGRPPLTKAIVNSYKNHLEQTGKGPAAINQILSAIRKLVREAADNGAIDPVHATGIANVKGVKFETLPAGRSISPGELSALLNACIDDQTPAGARDAAMIGLLYGCGLRRAELVSLDMTDFDPATSELKILRAKGNKQRTAHVTSGAKAALEDWLAIRGAFPGPLFLQIRKGGHVKPYRLTTQAVYTILQNRAQQAGVDDVSPHDFRRTFVGDLLDAGADIATVQRMAGHADVSTTARYDRRGEETKRKAAQLLHVPYIRRTTSI